MATVLDTLYPPQVETFMPSFVKNEAAKVWFKVSSYDETKINLIKYVHISIVDQRTNQNVLKATNTSNKTIYPQYYPLLFNKDNVEGVQNNAEYRTGYDSNKKMYWVVIPSIVIKNGYNTNQYYKIQLRFDLTEVNGNGSPINFFPWNGKKADALQLAAYTEDNRDSFSEWSTGTLIKPIEKPQLNLNYFNKNNYTQVKPSTDLLISGKVTFKDNEQLSWYQIKIVKNSNIYYDSNKIYSKDGQTFYYRIDIHELAISENYQMQFIYETIHGYNEISTYNIRVIDYIDEDTNEKYSLEKDEDNGNIILNITDIEENIEGSLIVRRSSHYSNFRHWDLIGVYKLPITGNTITIKDNSIESMTGYRYRFQYVNNNQEKRPKETEIVHCDFYGGIFLDNEKILKISFNFQLSDQSNAINRTKTDTLGGRYPIFTQNANLKYHTYNISGRISTEDSGELFLSKQSVFGSANDNNSYYNYRYNYDNIKDTSLFDGISGSSVPINRIKSDNDWLYEREYREAVENWLNNGKPKLFKSMTEGNIIVMLDNISLVPDSVLGRRLYDFNATMYEIGDGKDLNTIVAFGLFDIVNQD